MKIFRNVNPAIAAVAIVALLAALLIVFLPHNGTRTLTADFPRTVSLYKGSDVKILGVAVGKVTSVTPMGTKVRVAIEYDDQYKLPADAKAAVIAPSIVGDRFVQLTPAYTSGAVLADNAELGVDRTAVPLELDQIFGSLNDLNIALGPEGANKNGALTRLLDSTSRNFGGQGVKFNQTIQDLGKLTSTLANNKDELFGTAAEIEKFINTLAKNDQTVRDFNDSLAAGSAMLADDREELAAALQNLTTAMVAVRTFVRENRTALTSNILGLTRVTNTVVKRRTQLNEILRVAPAALNNLFLAYNPTSGTLDTRDSIGELGTKLSSNPDQVLCSLVVELGNLPDCPLNGLGRTTPFKELRVAQDKARQKVDLSLGGLVEVQP